MNRERVMIGVFGVDQHENGAIAVARFLRDAQMDVRYAGLFLTPQTLLEKAQAEEVDVIGISCHSWEFQHYLPELMRLLSELERPIPVVVGGSVLTSQDRQELERLGVDGVFPAGSQPDDIIHRIKDLARSKEQVARKTADSNGPARI